MGCEPVRTENLWKAYFRAAGGKRSWGGSMDRSDRFMKTVSWLLLFVVFAGAAQAQSTLSVTSDFDNGRVQVVSIDQQNRIIQTSIPPDNHSGTSLMRFWHYRISGITPGELITIRHTPSVSTVHYVYSYDGEQWFRFPTPGIGEQQMRFVHSSVYLAPNIPYPYSRSLTLATEMAGSPHVSVSNLATSEEGRAVKMLRITDTAAPDAGKRIVWMMGRQHAFESPSSYVPEGFARWMTSSDPAAAAFRQQVIAYVVPIMDVDNVVKGLTGKDMPDDWNRVWDQSSPPWAAVREAKALLNDLQQQHSLLAFIDSHNPYYNQAPHWHLAGSRQNWDAFAVRFRTAVAEAGRANWNAAVLQSEVGFAPSDRSVAKNFAITHWNNAADFLALTMESAHHRDDEGQFMTKEGYLQWGEAIGRGLYKHLGGHLAPAYAPPTARFTVDGSGVFDGGSSAAPGRRITAYHWNFGDGAQATTATAVAQHTYSQSGHYPVTLRVQCEQGLLSPPCPLTVSGGPTPVGPVSAWRASQQLSSTNWLNSGWAGSFRVLVRGDSIRRSADRLVLQIRGRTSGSYTIKRTTIGRRSGSSLDVIPSTWREVTFGSAWAQGVEMPANSTRTSDPVDFPLRPGEDVFLTFHLEGMGTYLNTAQTSTTAWFYTTADHSATRDWSGLPTPESRAYIYAVSDILAVPVPPVPDEDYDAWRAGIDWQGAANHPQADPRGAGVSNLLSYASGLHPLEPVPESGLPALLPTTDGAEGLIFRFRRHPHRPDVTYEVLASEDFEEWAVVARSASGQPAVALDGSLIQERSLQDALIEVLLHPRLEPDADRRFLKLRVLLDGMEDD